MRTNVKKQVLAIAVAFFMVFTMIPPYAYAADTSSEPSANAASTVGVDSATTVKEIDGVRISYEGTADLSDSSEYWFTACDESATPSVTKVYLTNTTEDDGYLSFEYSVGSTEGDNTFGTVKSDDGYIDAYGNININNCGKIKYPGENNTVILKSGQTLTVTITSAAVGSWLDSVFALYTDSFDFDRIYTKARVSFLKADHGTYTVNGQNLAGETVNAEKNTSTGEWPSYTVAATADEGYQFLQWVDGSGNFLSSDAEYTFEPSNGDMSIEPVFASESDAQFKVGSMKYDNWDKAMSAAAAAEDKVVTLLNNATLGAGEYTVPAGVTFVVPFDAEGTVYRDKPKCITTEDWTKPSAFRTLTLAKGAKLIVNGELSVPAPHTPSKGSTKNGGSPHKAYGEIAMEEGSNITVNDGGAVYAFGYITGEGTVEAKKGATVYEYFQLMDFKGGSATTHMLTGGYLDEETGESVFCRIFPLSQYYVQNIEVPLTINAGAQEYGYSSVYMSEQLISAPVGFIGNSSDMMFKLQSGTITKYYDGEKDRLVAEVNGNMEISPMTIKQYQYEVNSEDFVLPINNNITIKVNTGSNINITQDVALLPGSELLIGADATCTLTGGSKVYVYDRDQWVGEKYVINGDRDLSQLSYAPGMKHKRTASDLVDAKIQVAGTLDALDGYVYTTESGANVCGVNGGTIKLHQGSEKNTWQFEYVGAAEVDIDYGNYDAIPITTAKLLNSDNTYLSPKYVYGIYSYADGTWTGECNHSFKIAVDDNGDKIIVAPTCGAEGYTVYACAYCGAKENRDFTDPAGEHTPGAEATCTTPQLCTVCESVIKKALDHDWDEGTVKDAATCVSAGKMIYACNRCDATKEEIIAALGHTPGEAATCTTDQVCTVCGSVIEKALGHKEEVIPAVAATCTATGLTAGVKCSVCDEVLTKQTETPKIGHSWDEGEVTTPASCENETDGVKTYKCTECGETKTEAIKWAHIWTGAEKEATCTEEGAGATCSECGATTDVTPALGHLFTKYEVTADDKVATCTANGTETAVCDRGCGETHQRETSKLAHIEESVPAVPATCTATGLTSGTKCSVCDTPIVKQVETPATGHKEQAVAAVPATCTTTGLTEGKQCLVCQIMTVEQTKTPALNHPEEFRETVPETPAKCGETGLGQGEKCTLCGTFTIPQITLPALEHDMANATCTEPATCKHGCGYTEGEALGHKLEIELEEEKPFCEQSGFTAGSQCIVCQTIFGHEFVEALGHDWKTIEAKAPTYSNIGWNEHQQCQRCKMREGYEEYDQLGAYIKTYDEFIENLTILEGWAQDYLKSNPGKDPLDLVIKYIRTGVDRYNSGSWNIMAGYEDEGFANYVAQREDKENTAAAAEGKELIKVTGLKDIKEFTLSNGDKVDFGHMFGTMDITYHNNFKVDNADVGGWAGDIVDLLSLADFREIDEGRNVDEMASYIKKYFLGKERAQLAEEGLVPNAEEDEDGNIVSGHYNEGVFSYTDLYGDLDAYYIMKQLQGTEYEEGTLTDIFKGYFTSGLSVEKRAAYLIDNRLDDATLRTDLRNEVYHAYTANSAIGTLENTREWKNDDLMDLRKAACYAFADYICEVAGDYVAELENEYIDVVSAERSTLAPGVTQTLYRGTSADGKNMAYYIATCDVTRDDVQVCANYYSRNIPKDENGKYKWGMMRVLEQAQNAQKMYGNPDSPDYIPNYNIVAAINAGGYDMSDGEPGGLLVMDGVEFYPVDSEGFFGILKDGSAVIGTKADYIELQKENKVKEAIGGFGTTLVKDGKIAITRSDNYFTQRASRTAVGITKTGKVVFMVLDGRQGGDTLDASCGGSAEEIAQIMLDAGCVEAINLDGGGSSTFVSKKEGSTELAVTSKPSDGAPRSISTSLYVASTAPSSTEFDHAVIESDYSYLTAGTTIDLKATAVSATNNVVDMPEGIKWSTNNNIVGKLSDDGKFTAERTGTVEVQLVLDEEIVGTKIINVVEPDNLYYTKTEANGVHGKAMELPVKAVYNNKPVAINANDIEFKLSDDRAGKIEGFTFTPAATDLKQVKITASLPGFLGASKVMTVYLFSPDEASFDFENATSGNSQFSWKREVADDFTTTYTFGIDMSKVDIPEQLEPLTYMLPGSDMDNASAWTFLCNLAERMSDQTYVKAKVQFDNDVEVDYRDLTLVNDYFKLNEDDISFDKDSNTLTMTLRWIKQTKPINVDMANPMCILSGIKLTPKNDASWNSRDQLEIINKGDISYKVYMRASGLYTFASKPENQKVFGLYDYIHPNNDAERGGWFESTYNTFEDKYTLDRSIKNGWVMGDGGWRYYEDGKMLTGIHEIEGKYYKFDEETGINKGQELYTGAYFNGSKEYYINKGMVFTGDNGWVMMNDGEFRYYNPKNGGVRENVTAKEVKSTCIIDGYCDYTSASGATYHQPYDDAGGHEYETKADGKVICSECGWQRFTISECNPQLKYTKMTYTGNPITFAGTAVTAKNPLTGESLKSGDVVGRDFRIVQDAYTNNTNVGVAGLQLRAEKYGLFVDKTQWRGNYEGYHTLYFTIYPAAPTNVKYSINKYNKATVTWTKTPSAQKYLVQYSTNGGKTWKKAITTTKPTYTMKLNKKYSYMFRVKSIGSGKDQYGKTKTYESLKFSTAKLKTVTGLKAVNVAVSGKPKISWYKVKGANKYSIYRATSENGTYYKMYTTTKSSYTDTKATAGTKYYYKVVSVYSKNANANSDKSKAVIRTCKLARPSITLSNKTKKQIKVSWKKVNGANSYKVYQKAPGGTFKLVKTTTFRTYTAKSLKKGKTYQYKVIAVKTNNINANSAYSLTKKIKCR